MNFKAVSINVCRLNDHALVLILKNYLDTIASLDVLCIQEHKLRNSAAASLGQHLWPQAQGWCLEASSGYDIQQGLGAGRGGIITLLAPK
jgi:exonuclease III